MTAGADYFHVFVTAGADGKEKALSFDRSNIDRTMHVIDSCTREERLVFARNDSLVGVISLDSVSRVRRGPEVARIYINTDSMIAELTDKETYLSATFSMSDGWNADSVAPVAVSIKGRGNSTWGMPKKPYRLKFDKKIGLGGMKKAKSYVLLANYIDPTLLHNAFAFKLAELLGLPYSNHCVPADVYLNGQYKGSYMLTEKVGLNAGSIWDVSESEGVLYELSNEFDEEWKFYSDIYGLPVMIKDPDLTALQKSDSTFSAQKEFDKWKREFGMMEYSAFIPDDTPDLDGRYPGMRPEKYIDMDELARWTMVYLATGGGELNHPKSVFMYRRSHTDKFHFGPIWDFDWLVDYYGAEVNQWHFDFYLMESWRESNYFFRALYARETFRKALEAQWEDFINIIWPAAVDYLLEYADVIEASALRNGELYSLDAPDRYELMKESTETFRRNVNQYVEWIHKRINFLNTADLHGVMVVEESNF